MDKLYIIEMIEKGDSCIEQINKIILDLETSMNIIYFHDTLEEKKRLLTTYKEMLIKATDKKIYWITHLVINFQESIDNKYSKELKEYVNTPVKYENVTVYPWTDIHVWRSSFG